MHGADELSMHFSDDVLTVIPKVVAHAPAKYLGNHIRDVQNEWIQDQWIASRAKVLDRRDDGFHPEAG